MKQDYFIINGTKYIILMNKVTDIQEYYKEENSVLIKLTEEEDNFIKSIFKRKNPYILQSEELKRLLYGNNNIKEKEYYLPFLEWLESLIPEKVRDNFYRNLKDLKIGIDIEDIKPIFSKDSDYEVNGCYNIKTNSLTILNSYLIKIWKSLEGTENQQEIYNQKVYHSLIHELSHMASSHYDGETKIVKSGLDTFPTKYESQKNLGITEGITEAIAFAGTTGLNQFTSGYYIEGVLANQLMLIVGTETVLNSYFGNLGLTEIEKELNNLIEDSNMSYYLFRQIENNYCLRDANIKTELLKTIQSTLSTYFFAKLEKERLSNSMTNEEMIDLINSFERQIITEKIIKQLGLNSDNYINLDKVLEEFKKKKEEFMLKLKQAEIGINK